MVPHMAARSRVGGREEWKRDKPWEAVPPESHLFRLDPACSKFTHECVRFLQDI